LPFEKYVVGLCGRSRAGKSTVAGILQRSRFIHNLYGEVTVISTSDLLREMNPDTDLSSHKAMAEEAKRDLSHAIVQKATEAPDGLVVIDAVKTRKDYWAIRRSFSHRIFLVVWALPKIRWQRAGQDPQGDQIPGTHEEFIEKFDGHPMEKDYNFLWWETSNHLDNNLTFIRLELNLLVKFEIFKGRFERYL